MKSEERMKQLGGGNNYGHVSARPHVPARQMKFRTCTDRSGTDRKRWLEHQKKLALAMVRLCAGATQRRIIEGDELTGPNIE
jgi:hypothetical protein